MTPMNSATTHHSTTGSDDNPYRRPLGAAEVAAGDHRRMIGGMWDAVGRLQFEYLVGAGLTPRTRLVDIGCGSLRGGVHFVRFLDPGNYFGLDLNESLLAAGWEVELAALGLQERLPRDHLIADDRFDIGRFGVQFDMALAHSVFTHLPAPHVRTCLEEVARHLVIGGRLFATYFECPHDHPPEVPVTHRPGNVTTFVDANPYHFRVDDLVELTDGLPLTLVSTNTWLHPRAQRMACFRRTDA
jgi:SAM-dependent methyltransferase